MSIDAVVFKTFRKLGIDDADATAFAEELHAAIDRRYELHAKQFFTRGDGAEMEARLTKLISESQRWTVTALVAAMGMVATIVKLL